jgi:acyl-CoA dehydrogenase
LVRWLAEARGTRIVDGPDEVHKWTIGRNVIRAFQRHGTTAAATGGDLF